MNREILFRGKLKNSNDWEYGYFATGVNRYTDEAVSVIAIGDAMFIVDRNTVGQYTGLTDKNGNKIFEGDIIRIVGDSNNDDWKDVNYIAQIVFIDGGFCAVDGTIDNYSFRRYSLSRCEFDLEVIGNIHDNPKLLVE